MKRIHLLEQVLSLVWVESSWTSLLASGTVSLINPKTLELVPTDYKFEKPCKLVSCSSDIVLIVSSGHHLHTVLPCNQRFRLDSNLLTFATLSDGKLFLITETGLGLFVNNTCQHLRDFEDPAEFAFVFKNDKEADTRSIVVFPKAVAVLRGHQTAWLFPREPRMSPFLFVNPAGFLLKVFDDGTFSKEALDLAWRQVPATVRRVDRDLPRLQKAAKELGLLGPIGMVPTVRDTQHIPIDDTEKLRIPAGRVAYMAAYILSLGDQEVSDDVYQMFEKCVDDLVQQIN